jgi:hypothetical protein
MSLFEAYLIPHAIADATAGVAVATYLNDLESPVSGSPYHVVITPNHTTNNVSVTNGVITLPNAARYDVNQTYSRPYFLAPFTWPLEFVGTIHLSGVDEDYAGSVLGNKIQGISDLAYRRCWVICLRPSGINYVHIRARIKSFSTNFNISRHRYATGSITFDPIDTEWQSGWPSP